MRSTLPERLAGHLHESGLVRRGARVLVAISGGLDSVSLLHLLRFGRGMGVELCAAHFDHAMRAGSEEDLLWVRGLCRAWDVPLRTGVAETPPRGEAAARDARYAFLQQVAAQLGAELIATAHHADDQAETVLFRVLRGTGLHGLAGIPARRGSIVRPLLPFRRAELAEYARVVGLHHREDPTNVRLTYARNRIRHVLLPALERVHPGVAALLASVASDAAEVNVRVRRVVDRAFEDAVKVREDGAFELARDVLLRYHPTVRARVMRSALYRLGRALDRTGTRVTLEFIRSGASGGVIELAGGVRFERNFDRLVLRRVATPVPATDRKLVIGAASEGGGEAVIGDTRFAVHWSRTATEDVGYAAVFDPTALRFPLELRGWQPGDRIRLAYGTKKLKKLFAERRVARGARSRIPILAEGGDGDRILWVVGHARAAVAVPALEGPRLQITVTHAEHG